MGRHIADLTNEELAQFIENQRAQAVDFQSMADEKTALANQAAHELRNRGAQP